MTRPLDGWDEHLAGHPEATFYHTRIWAGIQAAAFPAVRDLSFWMEGPTGRAAVPLHSWRRLGGLLTTLQSSFPFLYGGPVPRIGTGGIDLLDCLAERLSTSRASVVLMGSPFGSTREAPPPGGYLAEEETTHLLPLPGTFDRYWEETLTTSKRNDVRRCSKKGVRIRIGGSDEEIRAVYRFYRQSFSRWGASPDLAYPEALYRAMVRLGGGHVRLYIAEADGRIIGGAFVPSWNGHVHYHAGYFDHGARSLRPNVLIQVEIVRHAIEEGQKDYDFLPSGGKPGVEAFKEGFGGTRTPVRRLSRQGVPHRLLARLRGRPRPQPGG